MLRVTIVLLAVVLSAMATIDCDYWCKAPGGRRYCCGPTRPGRPYPKYEEHLGSCPSRDGCPEYSAQSDTVSPTVCPHDGFCQSHQKCCYDTCLEHHVCKPAERIYG